MKSTTKDAKGFVTGIMDYLRRDGKEVRGVPRVQTLLNKMSSNARKERQATVESPVKLTAGEELAIARLLSRVVGHDVAVDSRLNTDLVAGIRIQMADWVVDTSFRGQLEQMAAILS